jgi:glycosyltransferase involved in cell wall biosynthesis
MEFPLNLTICITVRNERDNIEPIVRDLPIVCERQEILFVEGHSTDGTVEEIDRVAAAYPQKKVRRIGQPGIGQGDATRVGFYSAQGNCIIIYEGDGTSDPNDIIPFYEALSSGRLDFIVGNRFAMPLCPGAMPWVNRVGNFLFARFLSIILGLNLSDVLSGIKGIRKEAYLKIHENWGNLGVEDPFGDFELLIGAARLGLKIGGIPMHYRPRTYGETKTRVVKHGLILARITWNTWLGLKKAGESSPQTS